MPLLIKIFKFFRSVKLAVFLIACIITISLVASLVPQGLDADFYFSRFNPSLAQLILFFQFDNFFYSSAFYLPVILFFINIASCTVYRIYNRKKNRLKKKHGPDLIHISIILLLISGVYSLFDRSENTVYLSEGEKTNLRDGYQIILKKFDVETYNSGIVKDWISDVEIRRHGNLIKNYRIEVNKPCAFGQYKAYQYSYRETLNVTLQDADGEQFPLDRGSVFEAGDRKYILFDVREQGSSHKIYAVFDEYDGLKKTSNQIKLSLHDTIGGYTLVSAAARPVSGLNIVKDNSYLIVFSAIFLMIAGLVITYYQNALKGDKK